MHTKSSNAALKSTPSPIRAVLLTAAVVSVFFLASYFTLFRAVATATFASQERDITQSDLFKNRVTITSAYLTQTQLTVLMAGESNQGLQTKLDALRSDIATVVEYGISKQSIEGFWRNYAALRSDEHVQKMTWLNRTQVEVYMALAGAAFIEIYGHDFAQDRLDRLRTAVEVLRSYKIDDTEPPEVVKMQIDSALFLVQSQIQDFTKGAL